MSELSKNNNKDHFSKHEGKLPVNTGLWKRAYRPGYSFYCSDKNMIFAENIQILSVTKKPS